jgi:hypothetical protein
MASGGLAGMMMMMTGLGGSGGRGMGLNPLDCGANDSVLLEAPEGAACWRC